MPQQQVTVTVPWPQQQVDLDALRLAAAKVVTPAATNSHGVVLTHIGPTAGNNNSTTGVFTVWT